LGVGVGVWVFETLEVDDPDVGALDMDDPDDDREHPLDA
jgi:hypothetical protein